MLKHDFRKLHLIERNREWLQADMPLGTKLRFYPSLVAAYLRLILANRRWVKYFGINFQYDNIATPLNMQNYPYEISHKILRHTQSPIRKVLDVGGNIGQFPVSIEKLTPTIKRIDALEPNPQIFEMLKHNTSSSKKIHIYNYGVAKNSNLSFYFEEGRSGIGSFIKENASDTGGNLIELKVATVDEISSITKCKQYDLITIDVEGYEYEVLKLMADISTKYLYLEASGAGRSKGYDHSRLFKLVRERFGDFNIRYQSHLSGNMNTIEYLFEFH